MTGEASSIMLSTANNKKETGDVIGYAHCSNCSDRHDIGFIFLYSRGDIITATLAGQTATSLASLEPFFYIQ